MSNSHENAMTENTIPTSANHPQEILQSMTLREKVGQVFVFTLRNIVQAERLLELSPGGFIRLYSDALTSWRQHGLLQRKSKFPLFIAADFERGVAPVISAATEFLPPMGLAACGDPRWAYDVGYAIAREARAIGVNWNFMPTLDVNTEPKNPIINTRSFSDNREVVSRFGIAFMKGLEDGGCMSCAKHFPGHGATSMDSHVDLPVVSLSFEEIRSTHVFPFEQIIDAGCRAIMIGHLSCPSIDGDVPATCSPTIVRELLRRELKFDGVVVSDALDMGALTRRYPMKDLIPTVFNAGCDVLLMPSDPYAAYEALYDAVLCGKVSLERLNEAVTRILRLKAASRLFEEEQPQTSHDVLVQTLYSSSHRELALQAARESLTLIKNDTNVLPLSVDQKITVFSFTNAPEGLFEYLDPKFFGDACFQFSPHRVRALHFGCAYEERYDRPNLFDTISHLAYEAGVIVVGFFHRIIPGKSSANLSPTEKDIMQLLFRTGKPVVFVLFGSPYLVEDVKEASAIICAYGGGWAVQVAAAEAVFGKIGFRGQLPVRCTL